MSHIASFKRKIVGLLGSISAYHPPKEIKSDFKTSPDQLMLVAVVVNILLSL